MAVNENKITVAGYLKKELLPILEETAKELSVSKAQLVEIAVERFITKETLSNDVRKIRSGSNGELLVSLPKGVGIKAGDYYRLKAGDGAFIAKKV